MDGRAISEAGSSVRCASDFAYAGIHGWKFTGDTYYGAFESMYPMQYFISAEMRWNPSKYPVGRT
jgi:hypothetical protein